MRGQFARNRVQVLWAALLVLVVSCSGGSGRQTAAPSTDTQSAATASTDAPSTAAPSSSTAAPSSSAGGPESTLPLQPDWPLGGIWVASGLDGDGAIVDPRLAFTTDDVAVAAVVALGADVPAGATLLVEWFAVGIDERVPLFTHEIPVGPSGLAGLRRAAQAGWHRGSTRWSQPWAITRR